MNTIRIIIKNRINIKINEINYNNKKTIKNNEYKGYNKSIKKSILNNKKMVKETKKNNKNMYLCEECGFAYENKKFAEKCENYCKEHNSCSLEITKYAVNL